MQPTILKSDSSRGAKNISSPQEIDKNHLNEQYIPECLSHGKYKSINENVYFTGFKLFVKMLCKNSMLFLTEPHENYIINSPEFSSTKKEI